MNEREQMIPYCYDRMNWAMAQVATMSDASFWWGILSDVSITGGLLCFAIEQAEAYIVANGGWLLYEEKEG